MNPNASPSPSSSAPATSLPPAASNNQPADSGKTKQNMWQKKTFGLPGWAWILMAGLSQAFTIFAIIFMILGIAISHSWEGEVAKAILSFREAFNQALGIAPGSGGANATSCSGVADVPAADLPWVADAANKYLGGDQAALIALIDVESSWDAKQKTITPTTHAYGLGQFQPGTAAGTRPDKSPEFPEFTGGTDRSGKVWTAAGPIDGSDSDPRLDPERAIYAAADYLGKGMQDPKTPTYDLAYKVHYHGGDATAATALLVKKHDEIIASGGCKVTPTGTSIASGPLAQQVAATAYSNLGNANIGFIRNGNGDSRNACASFVSTVLQRVDSSYPFNAAAAGLESNLKSKSTQIVGLTPIGNASQYLDKLAPGDIVYFAKTPDESNIHHVVVYYSTNEVVGTSSGRGFVVKQSLTGFRGYAYFSVFRLNN